MENKSRLSQQELFLKAISDNVNTRRKGITKGPATGDREFFTQALSDSLADIKKAADEGNFTKARTLFASYIRDFLDRDRFFTIPYETPENIFKLPGESDSDACRRIEDYKVVSVGVLGDFSRERRIGWFSNPTYNGYREWTWQLSRHNEIKMMAHEYNLTGDEKIAIAAADIMKSWIEDAISPVPGTSGYATECWRTIECGIRMGANWPYILFSFIKSPHFTDDLIVDWFKSVYEHALRLSEDRTSGNWLIMEMNGLAHIAILFPFFRESGKWLSDALATLERELDAQFYPDGFQYELTTNYHDVVINNYQRLFETAKAFSVPLPQSLHDKLLKACDLYVKLMMPDGTTPDINDGRRASVSEMLESKSRFFSDDEIRFALDGVKEPEYKSIILPYSGFAVFRSGWSKDDVWALFDAAPFGKAHQHEDKLNFLMFAKRRLILCEGGIYAYDDSPMRRYIISTASHNTALVDGMGQDRSSSYAWHDEDIRKKAGLASNIPDVSVEWAESSYSEGYFGVEDKSITHNRKIYFMRDEHVFAVIDTFSSERAHSFDVLWHIDDTRISGTTYENLSVFTAGDIREKRIIRGQTDPEIQGFIATGQAQGSYKEVDCLSITSEGTESIVISVFQPKEERVCAVKGITADRTSLLINFENGRNETLPLR